MGERRPLAALGAAILGVCLLLGFWAPARPSGLLRDFSAFYCAGAALGSGADPYRAEPLGTCERAPRPVPLQRGIPGLAVPAPLPPVALLPFILLARLPYALAGALWSLLLCAALVLTAGVLRRLTALPWTAIVAALLLQGYAALTLGQIVPLSVAAIALAMLLVERGADEWAAVAAAFAALEPHVGLPACLALGVWRPRARLPLVALGAVGLALCCWPQGPALLAEYVRAVLPAHAASEIVNVKQLSLTYLLHRAGVDDATALRAGELSYAVTTVLGIALGGVLARRTLSPAFVVAIPPALAVVGGPFVHIVQVAAALPAMFLLYARVPSSRPVLAGALLVAAIPWVQFTTLGSIFPILAALGAVALLGSLEVPRPFILASAAAATGFVIVLQSLIVTVVPDATATLVAHYDPNALAEASWKLYVETVGTTDAAAYDLAKLPTWLALLTFAATAVEAAWPKKGLAPAAEFR